MVRRQRGAVTIWCRDGDDDLPALLRRMGRGLFVTEQLGQGVNPVTGDYSRGAAALDRGRRDCVPGRGDQIAGNLKDIYATSSRSPRCRSPRSRHTVPSGGTDDGRGH